MLFPFSFFPSFNFVLWHLRRNVLIFVICYAIRLVKITSTLRMFDLIGNVIGPTLANYTSQTNITIGHFNTQWI